MEYIIKIDKYKKDRFKIFTKEDDKLVYVGEKIGDVASYFDGFIGETYSKGANFVFFSKRYGEILKIERNFYDKNKKYELYSYEDKVGNIKSTVENEFINIDIDFKGFKESISLNRNEHLLEIPNIGKIESIKQGFRNYEEMEIIVDKEEYEILLIALAVYIWDVFIKNRLAFIK